MKQTTDTPKLSNRREEVNRFEKAKEERHRAQMRQEMKEHRENLDCQASRELVARGGYSSKGLVKGMIITGVGKVVVRVP